MAFAAGSSSTRLAVRFSQVQGPSAVLLPRPRLARANNASAEPVTEGSKVPVLNIIPESQVRNT
jgi:hypothetical protein